MDAWDAESCRRDGDTLKVKSTAARERRPRKVLSRLPKVGIFAVAFISIVIVAVFAAQASAATVTTDYLDYAPGEIVTITGSGWWPGETVSILLHEEPETHPDVTVSSIADADGNFTNTDFSPSETDIGRTFTVTATGLSSGLTAQTTFTDACPGGYTPDPTCPLTLGCAVGCRQTGGGPTPSCHVNMTAPAAAGTSCRASAGVCDVAETCTGSSTTCPADGFASSSTVCRADAGACDVAETCTGAGAACPADSFEPAGTACGSASDTVCDNPDTCNASGACQANNEPATTVCRADAGDCDVEEKCDGAGSCPANAFEPAGTACGSPTDTDCDNPDTCNASGACQANYESAMTVCRPDAGECDVEEKCDGAGACPANAFEPADTACGSSSDTDCDNPDTCSGTANTCLANNEPVTTVCRADAGECDVEEKCDGAGACPADGFEPADTACGSSSDTDCDNPDSCDGAGTCQTNYEIAETNCTEDGNQCTLDQCDDAGECTHPLTDCSLVTSSSLCTFDVDTEDLVRQFRLIFTPDQTFPNQPAWKLNASNPGQFFYNIVYCGTGEETLTLTLPYPFVTQGAMPIHIFSDVTVTVDDGVTCFVPGTVVANSSEQVILSDYEPQDFEDPPSTTDVVVDLPPLPDGCHYINIHLDYGLKGTHGYSKDGQDNAINAMVLPIVEILIPDLQEYEFSASNDGTDTVESENVFKRDPGFGGIVLNSGGDPVQGVKVEIYDSKSKLLMTVYTDEDGWYMWQYKYTGKAAIFTVKLPATGQQQSVTLKSNGFVTVNFTVP